MPKTSERRRRFLVFALAAIAMGIGTLAVGSCIFRNMFGEVFWESSARDHRILARYLSKAEPVRLAIDSYLATHGHVPKLLTDLPAPHPLPLEDRTFTAPDGRRWIYMHNEEEPEIYILGLSLNWDGSLTYRNRHHRGWEYDPGNGDPPWLVKQN